VSGDDTHSVVLTHMAGVWWWHTGRCLVMTHIMWCWHTWQVSGDDTHSVVLTHMAGVTE